MQLKTKFMNTIIDNLFKSYLKNVVSFSAKKEKISGDALKEIIALIENTNPIINPSQRKGE